jgi:hypothetical protein
MGKFDGKQVVLDEPMPSNVPANTPVRIMVDSPLPDAFGTDDVLAKIAALARPANLPRDFAAQHEHYIKGTPRK